MDGSIILGLFFSRLVEKSFMILVRGGCTVRSCRKVVEDPLLGRLRNIAIFVYIEKNTRRGY
jgi:hypothetical protein